MPVLSALSCNLDQQLLLAALPLLQEEKVQAMEWSFDALYRMPELPEWFAGLLDAFSREDRLIGHGVFFSLFSGTWSVAQQQWLDQLRLIRKRFPLDQVTEHFGFMTGQDFHKGAPMPVPFTPAVLRLGRDRLARIAEAADCPVGLENLAFACSAEQVRQHGEFLEELVAPLNGFIILDLHNLYCQLHNFALDYEDLIAMYPLHRVREIHISGGSWDGPDPGSAESVRRDTHDDAVPEAVFRLLEQTIGRCPNLKYVVLEQLGSALDSHSSRTQFYLDFLRMDRITGAHNLQAQEQDWTAFRLPLFRVADAIPEDAALQQQQLVLSRILETATDPADALTQLRRSVLAGSAWQIDDWSPRMLDTAMKIARKWQYGFEGRLPGFQPDK